MNKKKSSYLTFSNLKWCIDNDFQVYIKPDQYNKWKVAYRRGGITTEGKDKKLINGSMFYSVEVEGEKTYKNQKSAMAVVPDVYDFLRKKYGKKKVALDRAIKKNPLLKELINQFDLL